MTASPASEDDKVVLNNPKPVPRPGTWISAAIVTILGAMLIHGLVTNEKFHWSTVWFFLREVHVVKAVGWTLLLTFMAMAIGIVLAVTTAILRQSSNPVLRWVALAYLWFFRGTPIYTQLVFWGALSALYQKLSLGIPFGPELLTFKTTTVFTPFVAAVLGLGINEGAYLSEIVRSGLNSVDKGQSEAAGALGMSRGRERDDLHAQDDLLGAGGPLHPGSDLRHQLLRFADLPDHSAASGRGHLVHHHHLDPHGGTALHRALLRQGLRL